MASLPTISRRVDSIPPSATKLMPMVAAKVGGCVSLGQGVPSFPTPPHVVDAVCKALRDTPTSGMYSLQPGLPELRQAIADQLKSERLVTADPDTEIAVTAGAMEALLGAIMALVNPGDQVIVPTPHYPSHVEQILLAGGEPVLVPLRAEDWSLDPDAIRAAVTPRTKAIIINTPHNPTGAVFHTKDLLPVADLALRENIVVICDNTYERLEYHNELTVNLASIPALKPLLVTVSSFSKRYAMTGWRVGYVHAPRELMAAILKVHDASVICAPTPSQYAALAAITGPQDIYESYRDTLKERLDRTCAHLDRLSDHFSYNPPQGAFYIMARYTFTDQDSMALATRLIQEAKVITIPGGSFGPQTEGHLRLSYGGDEAVLDEAFARIEQWIAEGK